MSSFQAIDTAMVLAAGFGKRMAPLTDTVPKPLLTLCGKPLIDYSMGNLKAGGVTRFVVNTHYLPNLVEGHFAGRDDITLLYEKQIQETGGGVRDALPHLGSAPFFVTSSDAIWFNGVEPVVDRMLDAWNADDMDVLLLLVQSADAHGYDGPGDYYLDETGAAAYRGDRQVAPFVFGGLQILKPGLFEDVPKGPFRLLEIYHRAEAAGRLGAITHDGEWYHIGTPEARLEAEEMIAAGYSEANTR